jgi:hypothetical protein
MSTTYSTSSGVTYAETKPDLQSLLNLIPDNTTRLIVPRDFRDAFFSTWESSALKLTKLSNSNLEYVGYDRDTLKSKIYFGTKKFNGQEIMTQRLIENDIDYYFFNFKGDVNLEELPESALGRLPSTKIALLAGTSSFTFDGVENSYIGPYFEASPRADSPLVDFNIRNHSFYTDNTERIGADIDIASTYGKVKINDLIFPPRSEYFNNSNDGKFLKLVWNGYGQGVATWSSINSQSINEITSGSTVSITGSPVMINGRDVNFTDLNPTPNAIGGIPQGTIFDNVPVTEVLRQLLYPYIRPILTTSFKYQFIESGNQIIAADQQLTYKIIRNATYSIRDLTMTPSGGSPPLIDPSTIPQNIDGVTNYIVPQFVPFLPITTPNITVTKTISITDTNNTVLYNSSTFKIVLPWYYGTSTIVSSDVNFINAILGDINPQPNKLTSLLRDQPQMNEIVQLNMTTSNLPGNVGCIYFGYPESYSNLTDILDSNGFSVFGDFTQYTLVGLKSPNNYWGGGSENRRYKFYIYTRSSVPSTTTIPDGYRFQFKF